MTPVDSLTLRRHLGIEGDAHATPLSPRQVLVQASGEMNASPGAYRENVLIQWLGSASAPWPPSSGSVLMFGEGGAALRMTFACEACGKGAAYAGVELSRLKSKGWEVTAPRGMLATALSTGSIRVGDTVRVVRAVFAPLEASHAGRVRQVLSKLPSGRVTSYTQLAELAGAPTGFSYRGFPGLLKAANADERVGGAHRVLDSKWAIPTNARGEAHLPGQAERLRAEGVEICAENGRAVNVDTVAWEPTHEELFLG